MPFLRLVFRVGATSMFYTFLRDTVETYRGPCYDEEGDEGDDSGSGNGRVVSSPPFCALHGPVDMDVGGSRLGGSVMSRHFKAAGSVTFLGSLGSIDNEERDRQISSVVEMGEVEAMSGGSWTHD